MGWLVVWFSWLVMSRHPVSCCFFFFFQAEDGIRDKLVTGVQTCALPIYRIRAVTQSGRRAVVVGLGFIGSEVTASLRQLGVEVAAVDRARALLARVLGEEVGQVLASIHREKGVELVLEDSVAAFDGSGRVECDMVVAGIGIVPNAELLAP